MNWKSFLLGAVVGYSAAIVTKELLNPAENPSPEKVLANVKERVKKNGNIYGSWIVTKPEAYEKNELTYNVYRGGVTRNLDGKREQFEFIADAKTGTILELILQVN
jgi:predicted small secreted protein